MVVLSLVRIGASPACGPSSPLFHLILLSSPFSILPCTHPSVYSPNPSAPSFHFPISSCFCPSTSFHLLSFLFWGVFFPLLPSLFPGFSLSLFTFSFFSYISPDFTYPHIFIPFLNINLPPSFPKILFKILLLMFQLSFLSPST